MYILIVVLFAYLLLLYSKFEWAENVAVQACTKKLSSKQICSTTKWFLWKLDNLSHLYNSTNLDISLVHHMSTNPFFWIYWFCSQFRSQFCLFSLACSIRMSHWHHTMVDGTEFWLTCMRLKLLRKAGIPYSKASRYMASSCTDLAGARFWIGSKNIWVARFCTFLHDFAHFCTFFW